MTIVTNTSVNVVCIDDAGLMVVDATGAAVISTGHYGIYTGQYLFLRPHYINDVYLPVGTVWSTYNWVPTLAVDPLDTAAVTAFYNAGPRDGGIYEDTNFWPGASSRAPVTYWKIVPPYWTLTGLGAGLPGIPVEGYALGLLMTEDDRSILTESGVEILA